MTLEDHPYYDRMLALCQSIPCLAMMPECAVWDPELLIARWPTASSGERACIQFVLNVWSDDHRSWEEEYGIPPFTLREFSHLSTDNQAAVAAWFDNPFWP
jgi:hypothetical protein